MSRKPKLIVLGVVGIVVAIAITMIAINWSSILYGLSGGNLYRRSDLDNAHRQGYLDGNRGREQMLEQMEAYRQNVSSINSQVILLTQQVSNLQSEIIALSTQSASRQTEIERLNGVIDGFKQQVTDLNTQIVSLGHTIQALEQHNDILDGMNIDLLVQLGQANHQITTLTNLVDTLNDVIAMYQSILNDIYKANQRIVTFIVNDEIFAVQSVSIGNTATAPTIDSEYVIINHWTLNDNQVNVANITIDTDTIFVANITHRHRVTFMQQGVTSSSIILTHGEFAPSMTPPLAVGFDFVGWSLSPASQITVNLTTHAITVPTTLHAVLTPATPVTITINPSGGIHGSITNFAHHYGANPTLTGMQLPRWQAGVTHMRMFMGLFDAGGIQRINASGGSTTAWFVNTPTTLYARWAGAIGLNANAPTTTGLTLGQASFNHSSQLGVNVVSVTIPSLTGYIFQGFYTATVGGERVFNANGSRATTEVITALNVMPQEIFGRWVRV